MSDENAVESSATETETATEPVEVAQAAAEPENTEPPKQEHMIPKSRLDEVIGQKKDALRERDELKARLEELQLKLQSTPPEPPKEKEPVRPPAHLSEEEQVEWLIKRHSEALIKEKTGMTLEELGTLVSTAKTTSEDYVQRQWRQICEDNGLDPESEKVQRMVLGLTQTGLSRDDAIAEAAAVYGKRSSGNGNQEVAEVETSTANPVMTQASRIPANAREAVEMASRGERAKQLSSVELIQRKLERLAADKR